MNKLKFIIHNVLFPGAFLYTMFNLVLYVIEHFDPLAEKESQLGNYLLLFAYFVVIALATNIFKTEMSVIAKLLIHYASIVVPLVCFAMMFGNDNMVNSIAPVTLVITVVYALIAAPTLLIMSFIKKHKES